MKTSLEQLKQALQGAGWNIDQYTFLSKHNECKWYAWLPRSMRVTATNCLLNDKPPCLTIEPYSYTMFSTAEFKLAGELPNGRWVEFKVYSVPLNEVAETIESAKTVLLASWEAACAVTSAKAEA